jgi:hypothetical protein
MSMARPHCDTPLALLWIITSYAINFALLLNSLTTFEREREREERLGITKQSFFGKKED